MSPVWRKRLVAIAGSVLAVQMGFAIADGSFLWPSLMAVAAMLFLLARFNPMPLVTLMLAGLVFGYVVGNRGFAQLMPAPGVPLLPAETVLMVGGALLLIQSALRRALPLRRELLNLLLLAWMGYGTIRFAFDFRLFGFLAARDFAMVYYAAFFYLAQAATRYAPSTRFLQTTLLTAAVVLCGVSFIYVRYPDFFLNDLSFHGIPLIFYKGDLVGTFMAAGAALAFLRFEERGGAWKVVLSLLLAAGVFTTANRASMLGLAAAAIWLALGCRWRFGATLLGAGAAASIVILTVAFVTNTPWKRTPLYEPYESVMSIVDVTGQRVYEGKDTSSKGDNNLFRRVWWQAVFDETIEGNPWLGLGFGHDLADRFVREYYPEDSEEFSARSPHNVLLTIFARMGAVGLALFLAVLGVIAVRTWRAVRAGPEFAGPWCVTWVIFTSACFGVVLEGPMGAVVFWTMLGVADASLAGATAAAVEPDSPEKPAEPALPSATASL